MKFYLSLLIFSILVYAGFYFTEPHLPIKIVYIPFTWIQLVMIMATVVFQSGLARATAKSGQAFVRFFMGATAIKLMVFMMIIIVFSLMNRETAFGFILHFFVLYLLYTVFEVYFAYKSFGSESGLNKNT